MGGILVSLRPSVRPSVHPSVRPSVRPSDQTGPKTSPEPHRRITEPHRRITINILGIFGTFYFYLSYLLHKQADVQLDEVTPVAGGWHFITATAINTPHFFLICNFDFVFFWHGIWCQSLLWVIMGRQGVPRNAGRRSSCSSCYSISIVFDGAGNLLCRKCKSQDIPLDHWHIENLCLKILVRLHARIRWCWKHHWEGILRKWLSIVALDIAAWYTPT